jgi:hypothetical protein
LQNNDAIVTKENKNDVFLLNFFFISLECAIEY